MTPQHDEARAVMDKWAVMIYALLSIRGKAMHPEIQTRLIRETLDRLKLLADGPADDLRTRYGEFSALTDSLSTLTRSSALLGLLGPSVHFEPDGHMWL